MFFTASFAILPSLKQAFEAMANDLIQFVPKLTVGMIVFIVGFLFATLLAKIIRAVFRYTGIDKLFMQSSLAPALAGVGLKIIPGLLVSRLIYWMILLFTIKTSADSAQLDDISQVIVMIFIFLPKALMAFLVLIVGFLIGDQLRKTITASLEKLGVDYAKSIGKLVFGFTIVIVLTVFLSQLNIQAELLTASVKIILGAASFAFALGIGLGVKDAAAALISGVYARDFMPAGTWVELEGNSYQLLGIGPLTAKFRGLEGEFVIVPNTKLTSSIIRSKAPPQVP